MVFLRWASSSTCAVSTRDGSVAAGALGGLVCAAARAALTNAAAPAARATPCLRDISVFLDLGSMVSLTRWRARRGAFESASKTGELTCHSHGIPSENAVADLQAAAAA